MPEQQQSDEKRDAHHFLVTAVERAEADGRIAVTLVDARGGRVTLHLDEENAQALRALLDGQIK